MEGRRKFCGGRGLLELVEVFRGGDELVNCVHRCCPKVRITVHKAKPREGSARDRARISGGLGVSGVGPDDCWYLLEKHLSDVLGDDAWDYEF